MNTSTLVKSLGLLNFPEVLPLVCFFIGDSAVQIKSVTFLAAQQILITFLKKRMILMRDILRQICVNPIFFINTILQ